MSDAEKRTFTDDEALAFHREPHARQDRRGRDQADGDPARPVSLAYSPGVAVPVLAIAEDPDTAYDYTSKGNLVAVISNGTAILGLGDLGALASKPVMEGKAVLFKRFADVDSIDVEVRRRDPDEIITVVKNIGLTFGGINLEDIKSPECFRIETELQELLDIPVFHDDQHGTAIISAAGLINACEITGRKLVGHQAGAERRRRGGHRHARPDQGDGRAAGELHRGRHQGRDLPRPHRGHEPVEVGPRGRDRRPHPGRRAEGRRRLLRPVGQGRAHAGDGGPMAPQPDHLRHGQSRSGDHARRRRRRCGPDAIVATGRSDYPNQVNNVLGFPYIFRGALDVRARRVNMEMKIACANALAQLAREDVPDEVAAAYHGRAAEVRARLHHPLAVRPAADLVHPAVRRPGGDGHRRRAPADRRHGRLSRRAWPGGSIPTAGFLQKISGAVQSAPKKRIVFAEGEEPAVIRAAYAFQSQGLGKAVLVGREELVRREHARRPASTPPRPSWRSSTRASRTTMPSSSTSSTRACSATAICAATCSG